ncbi:hypothetical protein [Streptomyces sp. AM 2-1-1]|uniref:hypothetical protein n=1 Tax=Streptomyces sp. AM 2-1-1 TaxID=3028709 RepID=UPI0023B9E32A|nr:hypothetical protein [Streptomyces sp. AM 2-1-1]WEH40525.1 hypothetical protein PZB77_13985 [Streptomyces sp. AM 2-1-1]
MVEPDDSGEGVAAGRVDGRGGGGGVVVHPVEGEIGLAPEGFLVREALRVAAAPVVRRRQLEEVIAAPASRREAPRPARVLRSSFSGMFAVPLPVHP